MSDASEKKRVERIHCNQCRQKTHHELLYKTIEVEEQELGDDFGWIEWELTFETLRCCGCGYSVLRRTAIAESDPDSIDIRYYPPAISRHPPSWLYLRALPDGIRSVMLEVYRSLDAANARLPMMGARTLVDMLMVDKVGDDGTFGERLKRLEGLGVISSSNREVLRAALDVGHAAVHRGHAPRSEEVAAVMDIVENLLHAVYVLPDMADSLKKTTPARQTKKSST